MSTIWIISAAILCAGPIYTLDNGAIRIEVEPRLFATRFVGFPVGENFVEPISVDATVADGKDWADAGGVHSDLIPYSGKDAAIRRGPAEVLEHRSDYIAMLGPPSEGTGMRLKKEIQLDGAAPRAHFRVTAQRVAAEPASYALRNTVRLAPKNTVRLERTDGDIRVLAGSDSLVGVIKSRRYWLIPIPPTRDLAGIVLGAGAPRMIVANDSGTWTRTLVEPPADKSRVPNECTFLCVLDSPSGSYGAALQGQAGALKTGEFVTLEEEWTFEKRGK